MDQSENGNLVAIRRCTKRRQADRYVRELAAIGIWSTITREGRFTLNVMHEDAARADEELVAYDGENRERLELYDAFWDGIYDTRDRSKWRDGEWRDGEWLLKWGQYVRAKDAYEREIPVLETALEHLDESCAELAKPQLPEHIVRLVQEDIREELEDTISDAVRGQKRVLKALKRGHKNTPWEEVYQKLSRKKSPSDPYRLFRLLCYIGICIPIWLWLNLWIALLITAVLFLILLFEYMVLIRATYDWGDVPIQVREKARRDGWEL